MDFIAGPDLHQVITATGHLEPMRAARIGAGIARGLAAIHDQGIVHRDLKPHNILLAEGERPLIADFGVAHELDATRITGTGRLVGTPLYMAPEQIGRDDLTSAADLYSLGTMLYEMFTGDAPFAGLDLVNTIRAIREQDPEPLPDRIPAELRFIVERLLAKAPEDRPPNAAAVAESLAPRD